MTAGIKHGSFAPESRSIPTVDLETRSKGRDHRSRAQMRRRWQRPGFSLALEISTVLESLVGFSSPTQSSINVLEVQITHKVLLDTFITHCHL